MNAVILYIEVDIIQTLHVVNKFREMTFNNDNC